MMQIYAANKGDNILRNIYIYIHTYIVYVFTPNLDYSATISIILASSLAARLLLNKQQSGRQQGETE